jgi:hypothetical protein
MYEINIFPCSCPKFYSDLPFEVTKKDGQINVTVTGELKHTVCPECEAKIIKRI